MLRRTLLAMSGSDRIREIATSAPYARDVVARFVAGEQASDALSVTRRLLDAGLLVTIDYLGEATTDREQAARVVTEYTALLGALRAEGLSADGATEVSVKPTAVGLGLAEHGEKTATENIARICAAAHEAGTTVTLDAEDYATVQPTLRIVSQLRQEFADLGCVIQSYLRRSAGDCAAMSGEGARIRLCKGAYQAPAEVAFGSRREVDRSYAHCLRILCAAAGYPMFATHDPRLITIAGARAAHAGRPVASYEYQMLYGVRPDEQRRLAGAGAQVRIYLPYGDDWYGYLVRRLAERPANLAFFLRSVMSRR